MVMQLEANLHKGLINGYTPNISQQQEICSNIKKESILGFFFIIYTILYVVKPKSIKKLGYSLYN